jgi:hypothetical protein
MFGGLFKARISSALSIGFLLTLIVPISAASEKGSPAPLVTCINLSTKAERISSTGTCFDLKEAPVKWRTSSSDLAVPSDVQYKTITICSSTSNSKFKYRVIRSKCGKYQEASTYMRTVAKPAQPIVAATLLDNESQISLKLENNPNSNLDAPIAFYTVKLSDGTTRKISSRSSLNLALKELSENTNYSFTVSATSADGTSQVSVATAPVKTPVRAAPPVKPSEDFGTTSIPSPPSITLTANAETVTANTVATGFTVNSSGGTVASYSISPSVPSGITFNTSSGAFAGTPTTSASATRFTVTATNAGGSATATFDLTVSAPVPDTVISVAAIGGVTRPVTGATPVSTVTTANGYTGSVSWSGTPATFAVSTIYTATITLTAATGYTFTGVTANFFTVTGATSVTHLADSGVVTAVFPATVVGAANKAVIQTQPSGAVNGIAFTTQPVVRVTDSAGNTVTSYTGNVVASKVSGVGTLYGTTTVAAVAGIATFTNLYLQGAIGNSFLRFTPTSLTAANSDTVTVTIGAPNVAAITRSSPPFLTSGSTFVIQPQVTIRDIGGNTITTSTSVVTATVSSDGIIVGRDTATAIAGIATFANLGLSGTGGQAYTMTYTVSGITPATESIYLSSPSCDGVSFNCRVGDIGPAGGTIFYVNLSGFKCGAARNLTCKYLEAAPSGWNTGADPLRNWAQGTPANYRSTAVANVTSPETATATGIGWGYWNTKAIILQGNTDPATVGAALADAYVRTVGGTTFDDWYLASREELYQLALSSRFVGMAANTHLSSSELSATAGYGWATYTNANVLEQNDTKNTPRSVRPIRAF